MGNNKGITLISLLVYIVLTITILAILSVITLNFRSNISKMDTKTVQDIEFDKLNVQFLKETKTEGNSVNVSQTTSTTLVFTNENTYTFEDGKVYLNQNIKIAQNISAFNVQITETDNKQRLTITAEINGKNRITEYIINKEITSGYTELEYIESTGTQYIDTGYYPTSNTVVRLKFNMTAATGNVIFGYYNSEADDFRIFNYSNKAYLDYGSGSRIQPYLWGYSISRYNV